MKDGCRVSLEPQHLSSSFLLGKGFPPILKGSESLFLCFCQPQGGINTYTQGTGCCQSPSAARSALFKNQHQQQNQKHSPKPFLPQGDTTLSPNKIVTDRYPGRPIG